MTLQEAIQQKILVLDGAMGTMIQRFKPTEEDFRGDVYKNHSCDLKGNNDLLSITRPDIIRSIHQEYLAAGADIIETNTFSANKISMADYHLEDAVYEMNFQSAKLAKECCDQFRKKTPNQPRFVAGSIGPTNRTASLSPDVNRPGFRNISFDELEEAYYEQCCALADGGVDAFLIETIFDTLNAKAAIMAAQRANKDQGKEIPMMISGTITDASGRVLSGQTLDAFFISIKHANPLTVGLNCALGATQLLPYARNLNRISEFAISAHPNAGLPNEFGEYDQSPENMARQLEPFLEQGLLSVVGGCCGTSPAHIEAIAELSKNYQPKKNN
ncbi:MAG: homocysteine S-methyltransferase family protein [Flavobacteriales bacterium]|jgi:5-methyltetrahydrofolate--homocysteine methyltransferase|nr:homocysteine S-methyltransferase family protein [Flavobacteriales bacterium]